MVILTRFASLGLIRPPRRLACSKAARQLRVLLGQPPLIAIHLKLRTVPWVNAMREQKVAQMF